MRHIVARVTYFSVEQGTRALVHSCEVAYQVALVHTSDGEICSRCVFASGPIVSGDEHLLAHCPVAPVGKFLHPLHKLLIHHHFGRIAWGTALQELDA